MRETRRAACSSGSGRGSSGHCSSGRSRSAARGSRDRPRAQRGRLPRAGDPERRRVLRPDPCGRPRVDDGTWEVLRRLDRELDHLDVRRSRHAGDSHKLVEPYAGTDTWVFGVDGDELYDPERDLRAFAQELLGGRLPTTSSRLPRTSSTAIELDRGRRTASRLSLASARGSITKLYNFGAIESWRGDGAERLHGGRSCSATVTTTSAVDNIGERCAVGGDTATLSARVLSAAIDSRRPYAAAPPPAGRSSERRAAGPPLPGRGSATSARTALGSRRPSGGSTRSTCAATSSRSTPRRSSRSAERVARRGVELVRATRGNE